MKTLDYEGIAICLNHRRINSVQSFYREDLLAFMRRLGLPYVSDMFAQFVKFGHISKSNDQYVFTGKIINYKFLVNTHKEIIKIRRKYRKIA